MKIMTARETRIRSHTPNKFFPRSTDTRIPSPFRHLPEPACRQSGAGYPHPQLRPEAGQIKIDVGDRIAAARSGANRGHDEADIGLYHGQLFVLKTFRAILRPVKFC